MGGGTSESGARGVQGTGRGGRGKECYCICYCIVDRAGRDMAVCYEGGDDRASAVVVRGVGRTGNNGGGGEQQVVDGEQQVVVDGKQQSNAGGLGVRVWGYNRNRNRNRYRYNKGRRKAACEVWSVGRGSGA
jgi:hypothetical protein